ncbi:Anti-sigma regulatory factor (Ser/Thr protein kinase) [Nonomuraea maritima]|uniref:Anti-sigma regulatory factor (Ser/Thr protein kinase) n=1 Tax=Nonomuraea maritima TaxID=683260 RepID=A0A1G9H902_9ACTN|nr:ATP-binding protein [Nonomuraea maritima]SDL09488.1 Anti-sigma regulatory factor (Ser/Thr protein kinase) [Nonomuraea maritima]
MSDGPRLVDQAFDGGSLQAMRAALEARAVGAGMPEGRTADLVLVVHELATNVILHGSGSGRVIMTADEGMLHVRTADSAAGPPDGAWPVEPGHGLWIARSLSDLYSIVHGPEGTFVTVGFALPLPGPPSSRLTRDDADGSTTLSLTGPLDLAAATDLAAAVRAALTPGHGIVLDLGGVTGWDSSGIAAVVTARLHVGRTPGATIALTGLSEDFRHRLDCLTSAVLHDDDPSR